MLQPLRTLVPVALAAVAAAVPGAAQEEPPDLFGSRVAILVCAEFQDAETIMPKAWVEGLGAETVIIGQTEGQVQAYNSEMRVTVERTVDRVHPDHFEALVIPGGRSPANLRENPQVQEFVRQFAATGKPIAAICHGPQVLISAGIVEGRTLTAVGGVAEEITGAGATYVDAEVVRDGNLITSRVPGDLPAFCRTLSEAIAEQLP